MITVILLIAALVCFLLAAFSVVLGRLNWIGLGLALWVLTQLIVVFPR